MKSLLLLSFISVIGYAVNSQSNLSFNQVISNSIVISGSTYSGSNGSFTVNAPSTFTVPTNKTWKIESINTITENAWTNSTNGSTQVKIRVKINGVLVFVSDAPWDTNSSNLISKNAIWLKAGDVLSFSISGSAYSYSNYIGATNVHLSVLEYSIVP